MHLLFFIVPIDRKGNRWRRGETKRTLQKESTCQAALFGQIKNNKSHRPM